MQITQIIYAVTLADHLNFSRSAEKLYISQPTLSQQIQKLEREVGFPIFYRDKKNMSLTEAGKAFICEARGIVDMYRHLMDTSANIGNALKSSVSFGTSIITLSEATANLPLFINMYPNTKLNLVEAWDEELKRMLIEGTLDLAFLLIMDKEEQKNFHITPLQKKERICITVSTNHHLAGRKYVTLEDIANERIIFSNERSGLKSFVMNEFSKAHINPQKTMHVSMFEARIPIISQGDAITITTSARGSLYNQCNVVTIPIEPGIYSMHALCTRAGAERSLLVDSLIDIIKQG